MHRVIAITGKGGAGKTMLAALLSHLLARQGREVLAIDADSAVSLPYALGVPAAGTVGDIRERLIEDPKSKRDIQDVPMRDVISAAVTAGRGINLLVMGRPEGPGCFCALNDLLRYGIERLSREYEVTVVDCEAGPEQVNRRVVRNVDTLVIVSDSSARSLNTAEVIRSVAARAGNTRPSLVGLVVNRVKPGAEADVRRVAREREFGLLGCIPEDEALRRLDELGRPVVELPEDSPAVAAARAIARGLGF